MIALLLNPVLLAVGLAGVVAVLGVVLVIATAPEGWEGRDGFHYGIQPEADRDTRPSI